MSTTMQPKFVPLKKWAETVFGENSPHYNTLLNWIHHGRIMPQPVKMGRGWYVKPSAEYRGD